MMPVALALLIGTYTQESFFREVLNVVFFLLWMGWIHTTGNELGKKWGKRKLDLRLFRISIFVYLIFISFVTFQDTLGINPESMFFPVVAIFVLLSIIYCFYYVSKMLVSMEKQRDVKFKEHQLEFFLFFIFIVGIWILQPRINRLATEQDI
jgi:hypothetical protein